MKRTRSQTQTRRSKAKTVETTESVKPKRGRPKKQRTNETQSKNKRQRLNSLATNNTTPSTDELLLKSIVLQKEQERNFLKFYAEFDSIRKKAFAGLSESKEQNQTEQQFGEYGNVHFIKPIGNLIDKQLSGSLRIISGYENVLSQMILVHPTSSRTFSWTDCGFIFTRFIQNEVFNRALLQFRDVHVLYFLSQWKSDISFSNYKSVYDLHQGKYLWCTFLDGWKRSAKKMIITDSILMSDPFINEKSIEDGKSISFVQKASQLKIPEIVPMMMARSDFEITRYSLEEMEDAHVLNILKSEHKSRQSTYKQILQLVLVSLLCDLQILVIEYTL